MRAYSGLLLLMLAICCSSATTPSPTTEAGAPDAVPVDAVIDAIVDAPGVETPAIDAPAVINPELDAASRLPLDGGEPIDGAISADATGADDVACAVPKGQYGPFAMCTAPAAATPCDLVCQSGCGCGERCKLAAGVVSCVQEGPSFLQENDSCVPADDRCRPGSMCLQDLGIGSACGAHCYRHCRDNNDCSNGAKCSVNVQFGPASMPTDYTVCSPPVDSCNPWGAARCSRGDRAYPTFACYVMSGSFPDIAICDCAGTKRTGAACTFEHECEPGSECVAIPGADRTCRKVCRVGAMLPAAGGCPVGMICTTFPRGTTFGYCH